MSPEPEQCPKCGGALAAAANGARVCKYCGTTFAAEGFTRAAPVDLAGFYEAGEAAASRRDYGKAYEYFNRILELDSRQSEAWVGKAITGLYYGWQAKQEINAAEALTCLDAALACSDEADRGRLEASLADRAGAATDELLPQMVKAGANDRENLEGCLALFRNWEAKGTQEERSWRAIMALAELPVLPSAREPGVTYLSFKYPYRALAQEYAAKIRAKYEPSFASTYERGAVEQEKIVRELKGFGRVLLIIIGVVVLAALTVVGAVVALGALGVWTYLGRSP